MIIWTADHQVGVGACVLRRTFSGLSFWLSLLVISVLYCGYHVREIKMRLEDRCTVRCVWSSCVHECCWYQMAPICSKRRGLEPTGQPRLTTIVQSRRLTIFVHIARGCFQLSLLSRGLEETTRTPASHDWAMNTIGLIRMIRLTSPKLKKCFFFYSALHNIKFTSNFGQFLSISKHM